MKTGIQKEAVAPPVRPTSKLRSELLILVVAACCAASMWTYVFAVLIPAQDRAAQNAGLAAGNRSDLYPLWLAARELFDRGRDPYGAAVTREIQQGFYGRPLNPNDKLDEQRFAYPVIVCALLAPARHMNFDDVRRMARMALTLLSLFSIVFWVWAAGVRRPPLILAAYVVFALGSWPVTQAIVLAQFGLLCAFLMSASVVALARGRLVLGGALAAVAATKPHMAAPLLVWLVIWTIGKWRGRWRLVASLATTALVMLLASEMVFAGWLPRWLATIREYQDYTAAESVLAVLLGTRLGLVAEVAVIAGTLWILVRIRRCEAGSAAFFTAVAFTFAEGLVVNPIWASHNQVVLIPAAILLWTSRHDLLKMGAAMRLSFAICLGSVLWQWVAAAMLCLVLLLSSNWARAGGRLPLISVFIIPIAFAAALALFVMKTLFGRERNPEVANSK